jgi:hypothetical protein
MAVTMDQMASSPGWKCSKHNQRLHFRNGNITIIHRFDELSTETNAPEKGRFVLHDMKL